MKKAWLSCLHLWILRLHGESRTVLIPKHRRLRAADPQKMFCVRFDSAETVVGIQHEAQSTQSPSGARPGVASSGMGACRILESPAESPASPALSCAKCQDLRKDFYNLQASPDYLFASVWTSFFLHMQMR